MSSKMYSSDHSDHPPSPGRQQQQGEQSPLAREFSTHRPCPGARRLSFVYSPRQLAYALEKKEKRRARWEKGGTCTREHRPRINWWNSQGVALLVIRPDQTWRIKVC
ncbi:hypothetical protein PV05_09354 [Exophiala xenobiotica]|uniref:Uncharacterized protein n=1 Tax=Exophiala xenobiotica TaxID=348802 RepID=A0A0D2E766_9EURO|nr:uncharacterized protein PV05_09354 [Exophiala xenobiotica]KIW50555.1 hypothetical protein PV05_09354 [Exophiala xenobiotica]